MQHSSVRSCVSFPVCVCVCICVCVCVCLCVCVPLKRGASFFGASRCPFFWYRGGLSLLSGIVMSFLFFLRFCIQSPFLYRDPFMGDHAFCCSASRSMPNNRMRILDGKQTRSQMKVEKSRYQKQRSSEKVWALP